MCVSLSDVAHYHPRLGMQMSTTDGSGVISEETYVWGDVSFFDCVFRNDMVVVLALYPESKRSEMRRNDRILLPLRENEVVR